MVEIRVLSQAVKYLSLRTQLHESALPTRVTLHGSCEPAQCDVVKSIFYSRAILDQFHTSLQLAERKR